MSGSEEHIIPFDRLKQLVASGEIDTVLCCLVDMQGRLMGKRLVGQHFVDYAWQETHCCDYVLATDLEMATPEGYRATSWNTGYGDYVMKPDLDTMRLVPWLEGTAMVLCEVQDHQTHDPVPHSPRSILQHQVARAQKMGFTPIMATELEFFLFENSFDEIRQSGYRSLEPISGYNEDYHIFQTTKEEEVMRPLRNHLRTMGVPVEGTKGEAAAGQAELNIRHAPALACADHHVLAKHAAKEIGWLKGRAVSFLSKWDHNRTGSAAHTHQSLWQGKTNAFYAPGDPLGMSRLMRQYLAGLIKYAPDYTVFLAPYVNSYKRFLSGTFAPTRLSWSVDNRTAGFRICAPSTQSVRIECRIPGSDINPYLALASMLAAGLSGIEEELLLSESTEGNHYQNQTAMEIPSSLALATKALQQSSMLKSAFGKDVVAHYTRAAQWEQEEFARVVTDWEIARGFERA